MNTMTFSCPKCKEELTVMANAKIVTCNKCKSEIVITEEEGTIPVTCPNCNAKTRALLNSKVITCDKCGADISVHTNPSTLYVYKYGILSYDFGIKEESGNPDIPSNIKDILIQQLEENKKHIAKTTKDELQIEKANKMLKDADDNSGRGCFNVVMVIGLIGALIIYLIFSSITLALIIISIMVVVNGLGINGNKSNRAEANKIIAECEKRIDENRKQLPHKFLSAEYCNVDAIDKIISLLQNGRADDFKEALNIYAEEARHDVALQKTIDAIEENPRIID